MITILKSMNSTETSVQKDNLDVDAKVKQVGNLYPDTEKFKNQTVGRIYDADGISPTINCCGGGDREPSILDVAYTNRDSREYENYSPSLRAERNGFLVKEATKQGYDIATEGDSVNLSNPNSSTRRGRVGKQIANTLDTGCQQGVVTQYRIRKLTPRECFRLMGVDDADIDKIQASGISNSQQYKLAGNSIVVNNLYHIFRKMFVETNAEQNQQLTLF